MLLQGLSIPQSWRFVATERRTKEAQGILQGIPRRTPLGNAPGDPLGNPRGGSLERPRGTPKLDKRMSPLLLGAVPRGSTLGYPRGVHGASLGPPGDPLGGNRGGPHGGRPLWSRGPAGTPRGRFSDALIYQSMKMSLINSVLKANSGRHAGWRFKYKSVKPQRFGTQKSNFEISLIFHPQVNLG